MSLTYRIFAGVWNISIGSAMYWCMSGEVGSDYALIAAIGIMLMWHQNDQAKDQ